MYNDARKMVLFGTFFGILKLELEIGIFYRLCDSISIISTNQIEFSVKKKKNIVFLQSAWPNNTEILAII